MHVRPEDLVDLPEPGRSKLLAALAEIEAVKGDGPEPRMSRMSRTPPAPEHPPLPQSTPPLAATPPPAASQSGPRSLLERLRDWLTEEVEADPPRRFVAVQAGNHRYRFAARADAQTARNRPPAPVTPGPRRWAGPVAALGVLGVLAVAVLGGRALLRSATVHIPQPRTQHSAVIPSAPTSPASAAPATPAESAACAAIKPSMQPVPTSPGASSQPSPDLCYTLGDGRTTWEVGCARGAPATCTPVMHAVLVCLRDIGARSRTGISTADVSACAADAKAGTTAATVGT